MIYSNNDAMALLAMEEERTGGYGDYDDREGKCPVCGACESDYYYLDDSREECIGCSECIYRVDSLF